MIIRYVNNFLYAFIWGIGIFFLTTSPAHALIVGGCGANCYTGSNAATEPQFIEVLKNYLFCQTFIIIAFYVTGYFCGRAVQRQKMSANISRKIVCIITFLCSFTNSVVFSNAHSVAWGVFMSAGLFFILLILGSLTTFFRQKFAFLNIVFDSINRPEDDHHTLRWLATEAVTTTIIIICLRAYFENILLPSQLPDPIIFSTLLLVPIFASGLGDAMAEIIGKKFGRTHYETFAIFTKKKYSRTLEGSFAMFITTFLCSLGGSIYLLSYHADIEIPDFFWEAVILLPVTMTLAEAFSPHTWDNPFLYLSGYITILLCIIS